MESAQVKWESRDILPLSRRVTHLVGQFSFHAKYKSGEVVRIRSYFTGLLVKKDLGWRMYRGHESYKALTD